jgi:transcriptional regulator with XRE-family HTH domain
MPVNNTSENRQMHGSTRSFDGDKVKAARENLLMGRDDLAAAANCSLKTIERAENSHPLRFDTIQLIAGALSKKPGELFPDQSDDSTKQMAEMYTLPSSAATAREVDVELVINRDWAEYPESDLNNLIKIIISVTERGKTIRIVSLREGSVILTIRLTEEQARKLLDAVREKKLIDHGVNRAFRVIPEPDIPPPFAYNHDDSGGAKSTGGRKKLYIGNLSFSCTDEDLRDAFSQYGTVYGAQVVLDRDTGRSKGFGFVEMSGADEAMSAMHGTVFMGKQISVSFKPA